MGYFNHWAYDGAEILEPQNREWFILLATDGMLVKRPLVVGDDCVLTGFKEKERAEKMK